MPTQPLSPYAGQTPRRVQVWEGLASAVERGDKRELHRGIYMLEGKRSGHVQALRVEGGTFATSPCCHQACFQERACEKWVASVRISRGVWTLSGSAALSAPCKHAHSLLMRDASPPSGRRMGLAAALMRTGSQERTILSGSSTGLRLEGLPASSSQGGPCAVKNISNDCTHVRMDFRLFKHRTSKQLMELAKVIGRKTMMIEQASIMLIISSTVYKELPL